MIFQQSRLKAGASLAVLAGAIVAAAGPVSAQNNDGESFELTVSMMTTGAQRSVAIGESTMAQAVNQTVQVFNADASGFLGYATGNCVTFQTVDMAESTIELNGYCNYRDAEGDIAFEQFGTTGSVSLSELSFDGTFIGGTGKYESLTGTTRTTLNAETQNGDAVLVGGTKTGTFMLAEMAEEPAAEEPAAEEPAAEEPAAEEPVAEEPAAEEPAAEEPAAEEPAAEEPAAEEAAAEEPAAEEPVAEVNEEEQLAAAMSLGEDVFGDRCAGCHGNDGQGGNGPALAGNSIVASARNVVNMVIVGYADHGMPAFGDVLNNEEIAAAATYVRNSWGNDFGIVLPSTVERYR